MIIPSSTIDEKLKILDRKLRSISKEEIAVLPVRERIALTTSSRLIKHLKDHETRCLITNDEARQLIGCVKKLRNLIFEDTQN